MTPLKDQVGREAASGRQCANRPDDQKTVIDLLNLIPEEEGGTGGGLQVYRVPGYAESQLWRAIRRFQRRQFPGAVSGIVEPKSPVFARLTLLASRRGPEPAPSPRDTGLWDVIPHLPWTMPSGGVPGSGLLISRDDAVNIIRSALECGIVGPVEQAAILMAAATSPTLDAPSRALLLLFVDTVRNKLGGAGPYLFPTAKHRAAADVACAFLRRPGRSAHWPLLGREEIGIGMLMRIGKPGLLQQGGSSLCGPASLLFNMLEDNPVAYARFASDMYENGKANLGRLEIKPGHDVRHYRPPPRGDNTVAPIDWLTFAGIRDSENWFFDYDEMEDQFAGITLPGELASWFRRAGYRQVREEANVLVTKGVDNLMEGERLYKAGWRVCLFINAHMLYATQMHDGSVTPDHWVVLRSNVRRTGPNLAFTIFTWGDGNRPVPESGFLNVTDFSKNYYGFVAALP